jgi:Raf kinase inhibitor-like YbhB/YbcL family protein
MWDHWVVWNMAPETVGVLEWKAPIGIFGTTTGWTQAYAWPCPPDREHRYFFRIYALDTILGIPSGSTKKQLLDAMQWHIIERAELMGKYKKH